MSDKTTPTLGKLLTGGEQRDAVHIAVAPLVAHEPLKPGQHVGLIHGSAGASSNPIGIVDPLLTETVQPGQRFWVWLYPGTITSLRHEWTHPAFTDCEAWLRAYATKHNPYDDPEEAFQRLIDGLGSGELFFHGSDLHGLYELDDADELKRHAEAYLGINIDWGKFEFSCSC